MLRPTLGTENKKIKAIYTEELHADSIPQLEEISNEIKEYTDTKIEESKQTVYWKVSDDGSGIVPKDPLDLTPDDVGSSEETIRNIVSANFLPRSGGEMTGIVISRNVDNSQLQLRGAPEHNTGAYLALFGQNNSLSGEFHLKSGTSSVDKTLIGKPDGSLTWGNKEIKSMAFPSNTKVTVVSTPVDGAYTSPANGYLTIDGQNTSGDLGEVSVRLEGRIRSRGTITGGNIAFTSITVSKGESVQYRFDKCTVGKVVFTYAEGEV